jgi:hypothetical protein
MATPASSPGAAGEPAFFANRRSKMLAFDAL